MQQAPGIPCALLAVGRTILQSSGDQRRENAASYSVVVTRLVRDCALGRVTQYSRDVSDPIEKPQRTGSPACAGDDDRVLRRYLRVVGWQ